MASISSNDQAPGEGDNDHLVTMARSELEHEIQGEVTRLDSILTDLRENDNSRSRIQEIYQSYR